MTRPPKRSTARILVAGAVSGATMVALTPMRRAQNATPCAMLPAEAVSTPRSRRRGPSRAIALAAPRILKAPIGWRFSNFSQTSAGGSAKQRTSGVRRATPAMLVRASATWARVIGISLLSTKEGEGRGTIERFATQNQCAGIGRNPAGRPTGRSGTSRCRAREGEAESRPGVVLPRGGGRPAATRRAGGDPTGGGVQTTDQPVQQGGLFRLGRRTGRIAPARSGGRRRSWRGAAHARGEHSLGYTGSLRAVAPDRREDFLYIRAN